MKTSAGILGGALLSREAAAEQAAQQNVNTHSSPSALKIADLRVAVVVKPRPSPCPIIRIDTNQGVYGLGEVRDGASPIYALFLKSRLLNENPLNITFLFQKIKQFDGNGRQAGGVVAVEEALWDIAGKVYNVPIYQMFGGKFRDRIRTYVKRRRRAAAFGARLGLFRPDSAMGPGALGRLAMELIYRSGARPQGAPQAA